MGLSFNGHAGAIDWIQSRFLRGWPATLYFDEVGSVPIATISTPFSSDFSPIRGRHLPLRRPGGGTLYQIAQVVNRVGGYGAELLKGCPRIEAGPMPPRAGDVSMSSAKLCGMGEQPFQPWPLGPELTPTDRRWHFERPADEPRSPKQIARRLYRYANVDPVRLHESKRKRAEPGGSAHIP